MGRPGRARWRSFLLAVSLLTLACGSTGSQGGAFGDIRFVEVFAGVGLDQPVFLTSADDGSGRLYVLEQPGVIKVIDENGDTSDLLDLTDRVNNSGSEEGLLGLAFAPDYAESGEFFVYYTASDPRRSVLSRFTLGDDGMPSASSELVILEVQQPFGNHNGGMITFGPDGYLYVGLGDGGDSGDPRENGQDLSTLLGSILRIDVSESTSDEPYSVPNDNPFVDEPDARPEIWAYGLRNPWRFSFDPVSGDLYAADVGQNEYEEVNVIEKGGNYGWNIMEATHCFEASSCDRSGLIEPIAEYSHDLGCSITGGYVYRGSLAPSLEGAYVYADYCSGRVWALDGGDAVQLADTEYNISSFGVDDAGELYLLDISGAVYRVEGRDISTPIAPTPSATPTVAAPPSAGGGPTPSPSPSPAVDDEPTGPGVYVAAALGVIVAAAAVVVGVIRLR